MCGICGIIKKNGIKVEEDQIRRMMNAIKHRGPDDEGVYISGNVGIGFVRLSILDLSPLGHQPMYDDSGRFLITHNGEVYNFIEIRDELSSKGHSFRSNTDTEVILKAYIEWGENCLHKFNGMWAFCIYDSVSKELFFARDRFGVKPFYYFENENQFIYASEIPAILTVLDESVEPNLQAIFDYMVFNRTDQFEHTFFTNIKKLQHGHILRIKGNTVKISKWYDLRKMVSEVEGFKHPNEYRELFSSAVGLRLRSDVPVGVCLSGGLDSSSIVSTLLSDYHKHDLKTFSAVYDNNEVGDESTYIKLYESEVKNMFYITPDLQSLLSDLDDFVRTHAEPIPSTSPFAQFNVMKLARKHVVVTLDGQGADESLGGYHYFFGLYFKELLVSFRWIRLLMELFFYIYHHRAIYGIKTFLFFLLPVVLRTKLREAKNPFLSEQFIKKFSDSSMISDSLYGAQTLQDSLLDHFNFKLEHLLKWADRNSMFFSLESRTPFLDYRLVEKTIATSSRELIKNGWTKNLLRQAMRGILPESIRLRKDKVGFETPQAKWFRSPVFNTFFSDLLSDSKLEKYGIIHSTKAMELLLKHRENREDFSRELWKIVNLELWFRSYFTK